MANAHSRKKQPEQVRRALIDCAAKLIEAHGLAGLTVQAVASAAGVTKGGLFHHFASKQALVEAMLADLLAQLDHEIDSAMAADPEPWGSFSRAYVDSMFVGGAFAIDSPWTALSIAMIVEPELRRIWADWLDARLRRHHDSDGDARLEIARLAADGAWLSLTMRSDGPTPETSHLRARLIALCQP